MAVHFVREHHGWAAPVTFALESIALFSLLIPGRAALVGIGVLVAASDIPSAIGSPIGSGTSSRSRSAVSGHWRAIQTCCRAAMLSWSGGACSASSSAGFWPAARGGSVGRGNPRNALLDFSNRQFHLGFFLGLVVICPRAPLGRPA